MAPTPSAFLHSKPETETMSWDGERSGLNADFRRQGHEETHFNTNWLLLCCRGCGCMLVGHMTTTCLKGRLSNTKVSNVLLCVVNVSLFGDDRKERALIDWTKTHTKTFSTEYNAILTTCSHRYTTHTARRVTSPVHSISSDGTKPRGSPVITPLLISICKTNPIWIGLNSQEHQELLFWWIRAG